MVNEFQSEKTSIFEQRKTKKTIDLELGELGRRWANLGAGTDVNAGGQTLGNPRSESG